MSAPAGAPITYCFVVTNTGGTYLDALTLTDADLGIATGDLVLLSGTQPLAPGANLAWYHESTLVAPLVNTATVTGTPTNSGGTPIPGLPKPSDDDTAQVKLPEDIINICQHVCLSKLQPKPRSLDRQFLQFATLPIPPIDPASAPFRVTISTADGIVYDRSLPAGAIAATNSGWLYRDRDAAKVGGFSHVRIYRGVKNGNADVFRIAVKSYGEMTNLGLDLITVQVEIGGRTFVSTTTWDLLKTGWVTWLPDGLP